MHLMSSPSTYVSGRIAVHIFLIGSAQDIKGDWKKLGSGSFGNVYKGT